MQLRTIKNAASIAGLMLTTEALVADIKEDEKKGAAGGAGGGGMPGGGGMVGMY
jgi:chaperonin GroEL